MSTVFSRSEVRLFAAQMDPSFFRHDVFLDIPLANLPDYAVPRKQILQIFPCHNCAPARHLHQIIESVEKRDLAPCPSLR